MSIHHPEAGNDAHTHVWRMSLSWIENRWCDADRTLSPDVDWCLKNTRRRTTRVSVRAIRRSKVTDKRIDMPVIMWRMISNMSSIHCVKEWDLWMGPTKTKETFQFHFTRRWIDFVNMLGVNHVYVNQCAWMEKSLLLRHDRTGDEKWPRWTRSRNMSHENFSDKIISAQTLGILMTRPWVELLSRTLFVFSKENETSGKTRAKVSSSWRIRSNVRAVDGWESRRTGSWGR